ncbi:hypothetical protein OXH18_04315 [Thermocoleostomius sinensis A174]|uniref:DDE transposase family protein n=2 Tax=Thermocoleostomius TaxID=3065395 RepID=A0A9E9C5K0_9CYAN|nr:hypothetical protein OXH18_04315 [Thermocoleostomius sinensis A174]
MMTNSDAWYVVKQPDGHCEIVRLDAGQALSAAAQSDQPEQTEPEHWGPFDSQGQAIARRVGLIRAGKCQPL